ncbi:Protein of unknown function [Bacillus cytotoxicus]|uniref:Cytochrome c oxidase subunit 2A n=1 Tax=Bacillus cytotoxicus TaxID=580165 RepID=A0AAX2CHR1_9BACI|nr:Protein of unknown function [Bacillus cytotoxicus]
MENNKNGILALVVFALALAFFVVGMIYSLWGTF